MNNLNVSYINSQGNSQQDIQSKKTAITDITNNRSKQPEFINRNSGNESSNSNIVNTNIQQSVSHDQYHDLRNLRENKTIS